MSTTTKTRPAPLLGQFGPTLDAFLMLARAHATMRAMSLRPATDPALDKLMKRRVRKIETASDARMKAVSRRDWKAASAAAAEIRKASRELQTMREAQLAAIDAGRSSLEASLMATIRGEVVEEVETSIVDWLRDEDGARKIKRGRAILVEEKGRALRVVSRTGLRLAFERGHLDGGRVRGEVLYEIGRRYREAYEAVNRTGMGSVGGEHVGAPRCKPSVGPADQVLEAGQTLRLYRMNMTRRQRQVADLVCGQDMALKAAAAAIKAGLPATKKTLVAALTVAWGEQEHRMSEQQTRRCENCMWWVRDDRFHGSGVCRAKPPSGNDRENEPVWPMTHPSHWCGAFRMKEPTE